VESLNDESSTSDDVMVLEDSEMDRFWKTAIIGLLSRQSSLNEKSMSSISLGLYMPYTSSIERAKENVGERE